MSERDLNEITAGGCRFPEGRIHDWIDGVLDDAAAAGVETHLAECDACRALADDVERLRRAARGLPRAIEPPRDLWPAIAPRLRERPAAARRWPVVARLAAAVALIVLGGVLSRLLLPSTSAPTAPEPATTVAASVVASDAAVAVDHALAVAEYQRARATLERAVARRRDRLDATTLAEVERNLLLIDRAIVEIELALAEDPGNARLNDLLLASYRREIDLLRRLAIPS